MKLLPNSELYDTGYCVLFVRGISPVDVFPRIVGDEDCRPVSVDRMEAEVIKMAGEDLEEEDVPALDIDELRSSGMICDEGPLLRAGTHGDWCFVIESEGPYLAKNEIIRSASRATVALSVLKSESGTSWISYAEDGEILASFDPLLPQHDNGSRPDILDEITGYREAIELGDPEEAHENALRKIQYGLGCAVPQEADASSMLAIRIPGGY
ncbi:DUF6461 domain-containing protein [Streptomyces sp. B15]|uniref:DUF6461 domain-containing protein n=1 Tax=Streptomyces sp. B15 TaxID=1537797 RepID=UPI001B35B2FF|nr:DUF6461 domain-containing protein [Streptomyces sp. B15]MBQ1121883.1 hypothetical protein [Streptomyces sp. B15]